MDIFSVASEVLQNEAIEHERWKSVRRRHVMDQFARNGFDILGSIPIDSGIAINDVRFVSDGDSITVSWICPECGKVESSSDISGMVSATAHVMERMAKHACELPEEKPEDPMLLALIEIATNLDRMDILLERVANGLEGCWLLLLDESVGSMEVQDER